MIFTFSNSMTFKVIHDLYSQCLTQTLSETTSNREPEGVDAIFSHYCFLGLNHWNCCSKKNPPNCLCYETEGEAFVNTVPIHVCGRICTFPYPTNFLLVTWTRTVGHICCAHTCAAAPVTKHELPVRRMDPYITCRHPFADMHIYIYTKIMH
jgi:hypothetical protein